MLCEPVPERGHPPTVLSYKLAATISEQQRVFLPECTQTALLGMPGVLGSNHQQLGQQYCEQLATDTGHCCQTSQQVSHYDNTTTSTPSCTLAEGHYYQNVLPLRRNADVAVQGMALKLIAAVVKALGSSDRNLTALHSEALKAADRCLRDKASPVSSRCAAGAIITAVAEAGGSGFWANGGASVDDVANTCLSAFLDLSPTLRDIFASALGEMAAASNAASAKEMV